MRATLILAVLWLAMFAPAAPAQSNYPERPIHMIVPFAPGGASDFVARIIGQPLGQVLGQQIVIENRAGAAGNIGLEAAARATPDGYTIFLGNVGTLAINPTIFGKSMRVNPLTAFAPVTLVADVPDILIAHPSFPPADLKQFIEYVKSKPGMVPFASPGSGSLNRLEMEQFRIVEGGLDMVHVPYKGGAGPAVADVLAGHVPVMFTTLSSAIGQLQAGQLKSYGVATRERIAQIPAIPTLIEQGVNMEAASWQGLVVPAGTPAPIIARLFQATVHVLSTPDVAERLTNGGARVLKSATTEEFGRFMAEETARWGKIARQSGATAD